MISSRRVWSTTFVTWFWTVFAFTLTFIVALILTAAAMRFLGHKAVIGILTPVFVGMLSTFLFSEIIVVLVMKGRRATEEDYPHFVQVVDEIYARKRPWWILKPRLYVLNRLDMPNAMAFGWGVLGQGGVGITPSLYKLLTKEELKGVIAHEMAHIMARDVGLMMIVTVLTSGVDKIRKVLLSGKTALGRGPFAFVFAILLWVVGRVVFRFLSSAISRERELSADARGASYVGSSGPLISALRKLSASRGKVAKKPQTIFDDLMISHPKMEERIEALKSLEIQEQKLLTHNER